MRLYSLTDVSAVNHEGVRYEPVDDDGGFDFPPQLEAHMHSLHVRGERQWETSIERQRRMIAAEAARRADPATLLDAVLKLQEQAAAGAAVAKAEAEKPKPTRRERKAAAAETTTEADAGDDSGSEQDDAGDDSST